MNNQFSENLKKIRKDNNLSQEQLADELGVSRQAISKWESGQAYPEMDKIISLCDKFHLNIDDLLHKDIKEVKGEDESKKKINSYIDDFLSFLTNSINMFSDMSFKSKIKCLFEQCIVVLILFIVSLCVYSILDAVFANITYLLPTFIYSFIMRFLQSVLIVGLVVISIIILIHIFKIRYLDYYNNISNDKEHDKVDSSEKKNKDSKDANHSNLDIKEKENRIIIRDPKHSASKFITMLFKIIVLVMKFFLLCFGLAVCFVLVFLLVFFVAAFLLSKTGFFFVGLLISILASIMITIIILLLIFNIVFSRKNNKKMMIWSFIISLITFGIGCGFIFMGSLSFEILEHDESMLQTVSKEYEMKDDLLIYSYSDYSIEYVESDNDNVRIEYTLNKYCALDDHYDHEKDNAIRSYVKCNNPIQLGKVFINNVNHKKIIPLSSSIEKIIVYTNQSNIERLKDNWENELNSIKSNDERMHYYENEINELEIENQKLREKIQQYEED